MSTEFAEATTSVTFFGGGEMGERIRTFDWTATPLGPPDTWSPALRTMVRVMLANRFPHVLWWGPDYIQFYNDPYRPIPGSKHPHRVLGRPARECWSEIWDIIGPLIDRPFRGGPATWNDDIELVINRHGYMEETHFTIAYSPVPDETVASGIGGVLATVHEITDKVISERRVVLLRDLGARTAQARSAEDACVAAIEPITHHVKDIPFAAVYLIDRSGSAARLACATGVDAGGAAAPPDIDASSIWPLADMLRRGGVTVIDGIDRRLGGSLPSRPWDAVPTQAALVPIASNVAGHPAGVLVCGISPRLRFDDSYRGFLELVSGQIAMAIATARAYEEEKARSEALAALDRSKTAFFTNISHEFRTPLTLMLSPMDDALRDPDRGLTGEPLRAAHRSTLRVLKLVNSLLEFTRLAAGRHEASYAPTDLDALVDELTSMFRSTIESAGLFLDVKLEALPEPVYLDQDMWEKVILNLLSNAFKFTLEGGIRVRVHAEDGHAVLQVSDTGAGIRENDLPHVFERFYRAEGAGGRTHEGSGIGLALSHELVQLHGGRIEVESRIGAGTTFRVRVPFGRAHLPVDRIVERPGATSSRSFARATVEEAGRWLPGAGDEAVEAAGEAAHPELRGANVLVVDDNADLRGYVVRLLRRHGATVHAEPDGEAGLAAARDGGFDVVLADVMMPRLDGFAMARALKSDERTRMLPLILVSARAGESSRVEGLDVGADDYLVKPFSARELVARTGAQIRMRRMHQAFGRELERAVEHRTQELASINRQLVAFSYSVAHDLRAPVRAIHGLLDVLVDEIGATVTPAASGFVERIRTATSRMDQLITDLLEYGRIGRVRISLEPVKLQHAISDALVQLDHVLQARGAEVADRVPMDLPAVMAHRLTLVQALINLIDNATKFARPGHPPRVVLEVQPAETGVRLRIQDNGVGIAPEHHARVFQVFVQIDGAARHQGTGIGLAIVKESIERMHGQVGIESTPDAGSTFWIDLPLAQPAAIPIAPPAIR